MNKLFTKVSHIFLPFFTHPMKLPLSSSFSLLSEFLTGNSVNLLDSHPFSQQKLFQSSHLINIFCIYYVYYELSPYFMSLPKVLFQLLSIFICIYCLYFHIFFIDFILENILVVTTFKLTQN